MRDLRQNTAQVGPVFVLQVELTILRSVAHAKAEGSQQAGRLVALFFFGKQVDALRAVLVGLLNPVSQDAFGIFFKDFEGGFEYFIRHIHSRFPLRSSA